MKDKFNDCLKKAKELMPNYIFTFYTEYEEYYLFDCRLIDEEKIYHKVVTDRIPIDKDVITRRIGWCSSDMCLDKIICYGEINDERNNQNN